MIEAGEIANHCESVFVKPQTKKFQIINISLQNFSGERIDRSARLQRQRINIILKLRIANRAARIHNSGLTFTANVKYFRMI